MRLGKENPHEKMINSFLQPLEIILEQNSMGPEVTTRNLSWQEVYNDCLEEGENPLFAFVTEFLETTFTTEKNCSTDLEEVVIVALGEGKNLVSALTGKYCEEMAHLHLFLSGRYGNKLQIDISVSARKYFHQRLWKVFTAYSAYIFFAHSVMQKTLVEQSDYYYNEEGNIEKFECWDVK